MPEPTVAAAADNPELVREQIATYNAAGLRLRDVAKWLATSAAALAALLIGTSPLSGVAALGWGAAIVPPLAFGVVGLVSLGALIVKTSEVLAPAAVDLDEIVSAKEFESFRRKLADDPHSYLGAWASSATDFVRARATEFRALSSIDDQLADRATPPTHIPVLEEARETVLANIQRLGWVTQRLLAAAEHNRMWSRFRIARAVAGVAMVVTAVCIAGFLIEVERAQPGDDFPGPLPVRVGLTAAGERDLSGLLGSSCPIRGFEGMLIGGGRTAPWQIMVTDPQCVRGEITVTSAHGNILLPIPD